jgi:hypothetical protein
VLFCRCCFSSCSALVNVQVEVSEIFRVEREREREREIGREGQNEEEREKCGSEFIQDFPIMILKSTKDER